MVGVPFRGRLGALLAVAALSAACGSSGKSPPPSELDDADEAAVEEARRPSKLPSVLRQTVARASVERGRGTPLTTLSNSVVHMNAFGDVELIFHAFGPVGPQEIADLQAHGATISETLAPNALPTMPTAGLVQAWVPGVAIEDVAALPWVAAVMPPEYPEPDATPELISEGVALHRADQAIANGIDGTGITVGVVSDGVSSLAASQALGELPGSCPGPTPCVNVLSVGFNDEGTAMLEIVNDVAPGANLAFAGGSGSVINHINALNSLVTAGVNVITEDIPFDQEPAFQQGQVAARGEAIAAAGISIHSSAGNLGDRHSARVVATGTGAGPDGVVFSGTPSGCAFTPDNVVAIAPGGDTTFDIVGQGGSITLQWSEPRSISPTLGQGGFTDLNIYIMDAALTTCLAQSTNTQANGVGDTIEVVGVPFTLTNLKVVVDVQGTSSAVAAPVLDMRMRLGCFTSPCDSPIDAITRNGSLNPDSNYIGLATSSAAVDALLPPFVIEPYSGGGPVQLGSTTVCPGGSAGPCSGVAGGGPVTDPGPAPTWTAADDVTVSGVGGFGSPFTGTSAAAPHAAGCDALARQAQGAAATVASVRASMSGTAIDQGPAGADPAWGFGVLDCFGAIGGPTARCQDVTVPAGPTCTAAVPGSAVNNGSTDPNGDPLTFSLAPPGPFPLGPTGVTLTASDGALSSTCTAVVTVVDQTPPTVTPPDAATAAVCGDTIAVTVGTATAVDNCLGTVPTMGQVISRNGVPLGTPIPIVGGQVTLGIGTYVIRWTASDGTNIGEAFQTVTVGSSIQARESFLVEDRAQVRSSGDGSAQVLNSGTGLTRVGNDATSGSIQSVGPVRVLHRAVVTGSATSASTVFRESDATITGAVTQFASVVLPGLPTLPAFPPPTAGSFTVNFGTQTRAPGSYASGTVNGGTLILQSGDYFFQNLTINSGVTVRATATTRIFVQNTLVFHSPIRAPAGTAIQPVFLGFAGSGQLALNAVFNGTLVAPNAFVSFGTGAGLTFTGSFFARIIQVNPASVLVCQPSTVVGTPPTPPDPPSPGNLTATTAVTADWGGGYCVTLIVSNPGPLPTTTWSVSLNTNQSTIYTTWNGAFSGTNGAITIAPGFSWNQVIPGGGSNDSVGFCANRNVPGNQLPIVLGASGVF